MLLGWLCLVVTVSSRQSSLWLIIDSSSAAKGIRRGVLSQDNWCIPDYMVRVENVAVCVAVLQPPYRMFIFGNSQMVKERDFTFVIRT